MAGTEDGGLRFDDRMTDVEALLWSLEGHDPALRSTMTVVATFDRRPDLDAVADRIDELTRRLPRFRDRVAASSLPSGRPRWEPDPDFDLERHLIHVSAPGPVSLAQLLRICEEDGSAPLARDRAPWQMLFVGGTDDGPGGRQNGGSGGGGGLVVQLHHSFTDGLGAVKLAAHLFDLERHPSGLGMAPPAPQVENRPQPRGIWDDLRFEAGRSVELARRIVPWAATAVRDAVTDPQPRADATVKMVQSFWSLARVAAGPLDPILEGRSTGVKLGALSLPIDEFRRVAQRAGGTVNDVFLAGALGGLRLYHAKRGSHPPSLRLGIPISTREGATEGDMRNQFMPALLAVPLQLLDPVERIRVLHELVIAARNQPALQLMDTVAEMVRRTPGSLRLISTLRNPADVMASNIPGSPVDLYLGGAKVDQLVPIGPRGGAGLNLTLLSHVDAVHIGVNMDPVTIPDGDVLIDCLRAGFDETLG